MIKSKYRVVEDNGSLVLLVDLFSFFCCFFAGDGCLYSTFNLKTGMNVIVGGKSEIDFTD